MFYDTTGIFMLSKSKITLGGRKNKKFSPYLGEKNDFFNTVW